MPARPIITLTTDFGDSDYFVPAMKGVILSINPEATVVDLSHRIKPQDIFDGAFLISHACPMFPPGTIHCVVVDPGVGTSRRPIVVAAEDHYYVAPDNGVLSLIYERSENIMTIHATATHYFRSEISQTFHGRDIFAPLAAWISRGIQLSNFGETITDFTRFKSPLARAEGPNQIKGTVIKIDRFGNCITNISPHAIPGFFEQERPPIKFRVGTTTIQKICNAYSEAEGSSPFIILGSIGNFEIAMNRGSVAESLQITRGTEVDVTW